MLPTFQTLETPCLLVDKVAFLHNISMLESHLDHFEVAFRPHLKTVKSIDAASYITQPNGGCTVSTLKEAEVFSAAGYKDFTYAVGITEDKLPRVLDLINQGSRVTILLDSLAQAQFMHRFCEQQDCTIPCLIEIDCDGKRAGLNASDKSLIAIAKILANKGLYQGLLTHAGGAYSCTSKEEVAQFAERERSAVATAAKLLENAGIATSITSIGSTPTALCTENLDGISEVRAGVYPFFDLVMAGVGVCDIEDIALSVLTRVTGVHSQDKRLFIDAGWMALSRDRGTASQQYDCGYGLVCDAQGTLIPGLKVVSASQEHGIIECEPGFPLPDIQHGELLRILPNHACATAAQHQGYHVYSHDEVTYWPRFTGW
ncbi:MULTISPECIES: alanine racemase [unclassified Pseudoalteromonas]|uniref:alanine racemase n=1 Tax=unclassified Pseudoalteromonas TaxID=194690 RepID=UPI003014D093